MTNNRGKLVSPKHRQKQTNPRDQGKRPRDVRESKAQKSTRRSAGQAKKALNSSTPLATKRLRAPVGSAAARPGGISQDQAQPKSSNTSNTPSSKRKRDPEIPCSSLVVQDSVPSKRLRTLAQGTIEGRQQEAEKHTSTAVADPVQNWILNEKWPREYFEPDDQVREELLEHDSWLDETMAQPPPPVVQYVEINGVRYPQPIKKAPTSDSSLTGSSDQKKRECKSTPYRNPCYTTLLETKGSFLRDFDHKLPRAITDICHQLLTRDQIVPQNSLFCDDLFGRLCWKIQDRNEAMIIQDVTRLIVPSAMNLAIYGDTHLDILIESVNEAWTGSIPVEGPRPQPDYSIGFRRSAFTEEQLNRLDPLIGSVFDTSFFVATYRMYFPFLTCEVKCGAAALEIADRQNAHSMTLAVRAVVELFRLAGREAEIDRELLAFSVSHDHSSVRIYGHYSVINGKDTTFYRHPIKKFDFTSEEGKEKWAAYKFTKNIYDVWMPTHFKRLCSIIDQLPPELDFDVAPLPQDSGLSQDLESHHLSQSFAGLASQTGNDESRSGDRDITPNTSFTGQGAPKRPRRKVAK